MTADSPQAAEERAAKLWDKGMFEEAASAFQAASEVYLRVGQTGKSTRCALTSQILTAFNEASHALSADDYIVIQRRLERASELCSNDEERRLLEFLASMIRIYKGYSEGKIEEVVEMTRKLDNSLTQTPILDADWASTIGSARAELMSELNIVEAYRAYAMGDLVAYERYLGEGKRLMEMVGNGSFKDWDHFAQGYGLQAEGLLPLLEGLKAASRLEFEKAAASLRSANEKLRAAGGHFSKARSILRAGHLADAMRGYELVADAGHKMVRGDAKLYCGQPETALRLYRESAEKSSSALSILSKLGFLGAGLLDQAVGIRNSSSRKEQAVRSIQPSKATIARAAGLRYFILFTTTILTFALLSALSFSERLGLYHVYAALLVALIGTFGMEAIKLRGLIHSP